jgi:hypothetical protein
VAAIRHAHDRFTAAKAIRRGGIEDASWQRRNGDIVKYKAAIIPETITPGRTCVFFVTEARGELSPEIAAKPFEATSLCQGGQRVTGHREYATRGQAENHVRSAAARNVNRRR